MSVTSDYHALAVAPFGPNSMSGPNIGVSPGTPDNITVDRLTATVVSIGVSVTPSVRPGSRVWPFSECVGPVSTAGGVSGNTTDWSC